eukprot:5712639-Amphidinium_carterae.1
MGVASSHNASIVISALEALASVKGFPYWDKASGGANMSSLASAASSNTCSTRTRPGPKSLQL